MKIKVFSVMALAMAICFLGCGSEKVAESSDSTAYAVDSLIGYEAPQQIEMPDRGTPEIGDSLLLEIEKLFTAYQEKLPTLTLNNQKYYIVQGDERITEGELFQHWAKMVYKEGEKLGVDTTTFERDQKKMILGIDLNGKSLNWPAGSKLKFSITRSTFPSLKLYQQARDEFLAAAKDWEGMCNIKLEYHPQKDGSPNIVAPPPGMDFTLNYGKLGPTDSKAVLAVAFYRNEVYRKVHVFPAFFEDRAISRSGILRHEIGHVLGFRHEHISKDAPVECLGMEAVGRAKPVTPYDYNSVMHYMCGLFDNTKMIFTSKDTVGSQLIYGKPIF